MNSQKGVRRKDAYAPEKIEREQAAITLTIELAPLVTASSRDLPSLGSRQVRICLGLTITIQAVYDLSILD